MSTEATNFTEEFVQLDYGKVYLMKGGTGKPLVIFQDDLGSPGWIPFYEELASKFTVYVPSHPGFGKSERPDWMRSARDLALTHLWLMKTLGLDRISVVGIGFGGWVAAEMATMSYHQFDKIILVGAVGVQPTEREIVDQFLLSGEEYARLCFHDPAGFDALYGAETSADQREVWEVNREMAIRLAWKPYMFDQALPHLLGGVDTSTLVVSAGNDKVVPASCGQRYTDLMPNARLETLDACGHCADVEKPVELAALISAFISDS
jgi:pimeloyl-ACP methyl ester carboxylesterase